MDMWNMKALSVVVNKLIERLKFLCTQTSTPTLEICAGKLNNATAPDLFLV